MRDTYLRIAAMAALVLFAWPLPDIVGHTSHDPQVLGRYALDWFAFGTAYGLFVLALAAANVWLWTAAGQRATTRWVGRLRWLHDRPLLLIVVLAAIATTGPLVWSAVIRRTVATQMAGMEQAIKLGPLALAGSILALRDRLLLFPRYGSALLVAVFLAINGLVAYDAAFHPRWLGYDASEHIRYMEAVRFWPPHLPTAEESSEFFSPPLPYLAPALLHRLCSASQQAVGLPYPPCTDVAARFGQVQNIALSVGVLLLLIEIAELIRPGRMRFKLTTLLLFGMLPVYYKTLSFFRGEPFVVLFSLLALHRLLRMRQNHPASLQDAALLGLWLGLAVLSRQWGFMLFPAMGLWVLVVLLREKREALPLLGAFVGSVAVAAVIGGWFYVSLYVRYGSFTAFNREPSGQFALAVQPPDFYLGAGNGYLFTDPTRPNFDHQWMPIFYADTWGDYWEFFVVRGDRPALLPYLGRVNLVSLLPSAVMLAGVVMGGVYTLRAMRPARAAGPGELALSLLALVVVVSLAVYVWFISKYPIESGSDTVKAAYQLHIFAPLALLGGDLLERLKGRYPAAHAAILALLGAVLIHNLPAMITPYGFI